MNTAFLVSYVIQLNPLAGVLSISKYLSFNKYKMTQWNPRCTKKNPEHPTTKYIHKKERSVAH